jgi:hypothetical protein
MSVEDDDVDQVIESKRVETTATTRARRSIY